MGFPRLGSASVSLVGFGVSPKQASRKFAMARTPSPRAAASPFLLHDEDERADQRGGQDQADALQRPDVIGHELFADALDRERVAGGRGHRARRRLGNTTRQGG